MYRDQYNLYVSNISERSDEDRLLAFFSQFGKIESFIYLRRNGRRRHAAAMITYASSTDVDAIIERNQRMQFDSHSLFLRHTLPSTRPGFERFMSSNELLVSLPTLSTNEQFNESSLRQYFSKYGSIVSCRMVIVSTTFVIDFVNDNSVDHAILDEPHFYNDEELILRKYIPPSRVGFSRRRKTPWNEKCSTNRIVLLEKIRRLKDAIEAIEFGQKVELKLTKCSYERKKSKFAKKEDESMIELRQRSANLSADVRRVKESNASLARWLEKSQCEKQELVRSYTEKIEYERKRIEQLKEAIALLDSL